MSLSQLAKSMDPLRPVYLLMGDEGLMVERAEAQLTQHALQGVMAAFNHATYRCADERVGDALAVARTLPMMSERRVINLRDVHEASPDLLESLQAYCAEPCDSTVLIVSGRAWPKASGGKDFGRRAEGAIKKTGVVLRFKARDSNPKAFASETAAELGCTLDPGAAELLVAMVGKDLALLRRELEKAALYVGEGGRIGGKELEQVCSLLAEAEIWDLTDAIVARDADRTLATAHRLLEAGKRGEGHRLVAMITWQLRQLLVLQSARRLGVNPSQMGVRMPAWKLRKAEEALRRRPLDTAGVLARLARANHDMNSHRAGDRRILEGLLLDLVGR